MVRKRKLKPLPLRGIIDANDIETQVERDRLKEIEEEQQRLGAPKEINGNTVRENLILTAGSCNDDLGSVGTFSSARKRSQKHVSSNSDSIKSMSVESDSVGIKLKDGFFSGNRASRNSSPCDTKDNSNLPIGNVTAVEKNLERDDVIFTTDKACNNFTKIQEEKTLTNVQILESQLDCQFANLSDVSLLVEDASACEIDSITIVQNYLEQLSEANEENNKTNENTLSLGSKFTQPKKGTQLFDENRTHSFHEIRRKSSLRKKSSDDYHKVSVSFQEPTGLNNTRRVKSATTVRIDSQPDQQQRPKTAIHRPYLQPKSDVLHHTPDQRRVSISTNKSQEEHSLGPIHSDVKEKSEVRRKTSTVSKVSEISYTSRQRCPSVTYDPELEKATKYIHGTNKQFSRANTSITPLKHGLKYLQMNYSENNIENNQSLIFLDLLKNSCSKSYIRNAEIKNIERRLELKKINPLYSTTFYEHKHLVDPYRIKVKKVARTVAQKKKERKEKIKKMTDEAMGTLTPTCLTMKIADQKEVDDIGRNCRYLRCKPPPRQEDISNG